ncbi:TolB family protein, partial [Streptomyces sp. URMC 124]
MRIRLYVAAFVAALALTACSGSEGPEPPGPSGGRSAARADGAQLLYRGEGRTSAQNPAFSPDGGSVLFTLFEGGYNEGAAALRVLSLRGGEPHGHPG